MRDVLYVEEVDQAAALLKPRRVEIIRHLDQPRTLRELAALLGDTPQRLHYHVKTMEQAGLVERVGQRKVRGVMESWYQAIARSFWLAPDLIRSIGDPATAGDQVSLRYVLAIAEEIQRDIGRLAGRVGVEIPSLALSAEIHLPDATRRGAFAADVRRMVETLAQEYGLPQGEPDAGAASERAYETGQTFRLAIACYPMTDAQSGRQISAPE